MYTIWLRNNILQINGINLCFIYFFQKLHFNIYVLYLNIMNNKIYGLVKTINESINKNEKLFITFSYQHDITDFK